MEVKPVRNVIVIKPLKGDGMRMSGFELSDRVKELIPPQQGEVLAIGSGVTKAKVGDVVVFGVEVGTTWGEMLFVKEGDLICGVEV